MQQGCGENPQYHEWWTRPRGLKSGSERMTTVRERSTQYSLSSINRTRVSAFICTKADVLKKKIEWLRDKKTHIHTGPICWFTPEMQTMARVRLGQSLPGGWQAPNSCRYHLLSPRRPISRNLESGVELGLYPRHSDTVSRCPKLCCNG